MAKSIHVNGPCLVSTGAQGTGGGLTELGITEGGVRLTISTIQDDVKADSGGEVPVDVQDLGKLAYIDLTLVVYDSTELENLLILGAAAAAQEPSPGKLLIANNKCKRIVLSSPDEANPWRFFYCHLTGDLEQLLGSKRNTPTLRLRALPGTGVASTMSTLPLYDHTAA